MELFEFNVQKTANKLETVETFTAATYSIPPASHAATHSLLYIIINNASTFVKVCFIFISHIVCDVTVYAADVSLLDPAQCKCKTVRGVTDPN